MGLFFSDKVEEGIHLIWMQFDDKNTGEGLKLLQTAAQEENDGDAYCFLGRYCLDNDRKTAFELFRKSAALGSACGILTMLQFRVLSKEVMRNIDIEKRKWAESEVRRKADGGHAYSQVIMGMYYFWGGYWLSNELDAEKEYGSEDKALDARMVEATPWYEKALYGGLTSALNNLMSIYEAYPGNEEKLEKALRYAASCGDPVWCVRLPMWLFEHEKYESTLELYTDLAKRGYTPAWYYMGCQFEQGLGVTADSKQAVAAYEQGAKQGNSICQTRLGKLYLQGKLVQKDEAQAYFWFCEAARQEDEVAKMWKGHCMLYGLGTQKNPSEATIFLIDALNFVFPSSGSSQQMPEDSPFDWEEDMMQLFWDLGDSSENGLGLPKREHLAGYYFSMVAEGGWPEAIEKMTHYKRGGLFKRWKRVK